MHLQHLQRLQHLQHTTAVLSYRLPKDSEILVSPGSEINEGETLAKTYVSKNTLSFPLASILKVKPDNIFRFLLKKVGEYVKNGDLVAQKKGLFGLFKKKFYSPTDGKIDSVDTTSGDLLIKLAAEEYPFKSDVNGKVVEVSNDVVSVEFKAIEISAETSYNGKKVGKLSFKAPEGEMEGEVLATKDEVGRDFLFKASAMGALAIICPAEMKDVIGTFDFEKKLKVLSKEVSLSMPVFMVGDVWEILEKHEGKKIILDGDSKKIYLPS